MARRQGLTEEQINQMLDQNCESWFDDADDQSDLGSFDAHSEKDYHFPDEFGQDDSEEEEAISMELDDSADVFLLDQSPMRLRPLQSQDLVPVHGSIPSTSSLVETSSLQSQDLAPVHGSIPTVSTSSLETSSLVPVHGSTLSLPTVHPSTSSDNVSLNIFSNSNS